MKRRRAPRELHPAAAMGAALIVHALALWMIADVYSEGAPQRRARDEALAIEVELSSTRAPKSQKPESDSPFRMAARRPESVGAQSAPGPSTRTTETAPTDEIPDGLPAEDAEGAPPSGPDPFSEPAPRRPIDLGLNGGLARAMLFEQRDRPPPAPKKPAAILKEGLDALDAQRGMARSAPALSAARGASLELAPREGSAVFEIVVNGLGEVSGVTLVSFAFDEDRWQRVASSMRRRLRDKRLRVPVGSRGLIARVRVARGDVAKNVEDLWRTKRGVAAGQAPLDPRQVLDESTQASEQPGRLTPTLGASTARDPHPTRVSLLSERIL